MSHVAKGKDLAATNNISRSRGFLAKHRNRPYKSRSPKEKRRNQKFDLVLIGAEIEAFALIYWSYCIRAEAAVHVLNAPEVLSNFLRNLTVNKNGLDFLNILNNSRSRCFYVKPVSIGVTNSRLQIEASTTYQHNRSC